MWADNEATVDLLGVDHLVDGLFVALTQPQLLPLTCGLLGDWGSGKSSVLGLVRAELDNERPDDDSPSRYLCVSFSPWQHEGYEDVKTALISAVLDALDERSNDPDLAERVSFLRRCSQGFARWSRRAARGTLAMAPAAVPLAVQALQPDIDPAMTEMITSATGMAAGAASDRLAEPTDDASPAPVITTAARFREELAAVIDEIPGLDALVVLVDDMDRCLPDTVVDTFEAIRVLLGTHKTAYVIAANEDIVQAAVDARYRELVRDGVGLGARYLEKMLQIRLRIPALSGLEADTYMNLLLAQLRLEPHQMDIIMAHVRERRAAGQFDVAFNLGVLFELLGETPPAALIEDLLWAATVSPVLAGALRGNPRELKRFLNSLMLRHASALRRGVELQRSVLAKLMVLEEQHPADFRQLFDWQSRSLGPIAELAAAETLVQPGESGAHAPDPAVRRQRVRRDGQPVGGVRDPGPATGNPVPANDATVAAAPDDRATTDKHAPTGARDRSDELAASVSAWVGKGHVAEWLALPPPLADVDLRPYFAYSRDRLGPGAGTASLSADLQLLSTRLQSEVKAVREQAGRQVAELPAAHRHRLVEALVESLARHPSPAAFRAVTDLLARSGDALDPVTSALMALPVTAVPLNEVTHAVNRLLGRGPQAEAVLDRWAGSDLPGLASVVTKLRDVAQRGSGRARR